MPRNAAVDDPPVSVDSPPKLGPRRVYLVVLLVAMAVSLLYLSQTSDLAATSYDVAALQNDKSVWEMRNQELRLQIAELQSLDHVDQVASSRLHMGPPSRVVYVKASAQPVVVDAPSPAATPATDRLSSLSLNALVDKIPYLERIRGGR